MDSLDASALDVRTLLFEYARTCERVARYQAEQWHDFAQRFHLSGESAALVPNFAAALSGGALPLGIPMHLHEASIPVSSSTGSSSTGAAAGHKASTSSSKHTGSAAAAGAAASADDDDEKKSKAQRWTQEEDDRFLELVTMFGKDFSMIASKLNTRRTAKQCRAHWQVLERKLNAQAGVPSSVAGTTDVQLPEPVPSLEPEPQPVQQPQSQPKSQTQSQPQGESEQATSSQLSQQQLKKKKKKEKKAAQKREREAEDSDASDEPRAKHSK